MAAIENPVKFFRSLKGAPNAVLSVLTFTRRPMTNMELRHWTGYGHNEVTRAVRLLTDLECTTASSARGPWSICDGWEFPRSDLAGGERPIGAVPSAATNGDGVDAAAGPPLERLRRALG